MARRNQHRLVDARGTWLLKTLMRVAITTDGCWVWEGSISGTGYGYLRTPFASYPIGVHRAVYMAVRGPLRKGETIDHLCRETLCCNPWHLEPVSRAENTARGNRARVVDTRDPFADDEVMEAIL